MLQTPRNSIYEVFMRTRVKTELLMLCGLGTLALLGTNRKRLAILPAMASGYLVTQLLIESTTPQSFRGQSAVITGGSRGLGLALARELVNENCNVTLLARDEDELKRAKKELDKLNRGEVHIVVCDITDNVQLSRAIHEAADLYDGIDLLINNAGAIVVGPWESMTQQDFEAQMNIHLYATMNSIRVALPFLRQKTSGKRIVNICSMGGRVAVPHMLPYDTSKFAVSGFSQGLATELYDEGISVTTIYPGLMRTGSPIQATFKGEHEKEFAWFQSADVLPGFSTSARDAAREIIEAARQRRFELMPFLPAKLRLGLAAFFPELVAYTLVVLNRLLPQGQSGEYKTGAQSRETFDRSILTKIFKSSARSAEKESNQWPKTDAKENMGVLH
ncbi:ketoacyl reductase [Bdellovibrio sp. qaytius]|nr:ketoacyl reductase [Bdellovibrio sp. qaytius]